MTFALDIIVSGVVGVPERKPQNSATTWVTGDSEVTTSVQGQVNGIDFTQILTASKILMNLANLNNSMLACNYDRYTDKLI